jgi:FkbM family methyltransferase
MIEEHWLLPILGQAPTGLLAFDIGANDGEWTRLLSGRHSHVVAVEPDERAFHHLRGCVRDCDLAINAAAFSSDGNVELFVRPNSVQSSLLEVHPIGAGGQADAPVVSVRSVSAVTLDSLAKLAFERWGGSRVDFVKIDVEGAEAEVLAGATSQAFRGTRWLIEVHDRLDQVAAQLHRLGFETVQAVAHPSPSAHPRHFWIYCE